MSIGPLSSSAALSLSVAPAVGKIPDPQAQKAQVNAQADLLQAVQNVDLPLKMVAARVSDGQGVDLYM